jgi:single-strand DNA-binding protein
MYASIQIVGNVGRDPEIRYIKDGIAVTSISVAVTTRASGEEKTTWYDVTVWRKQAEAVVNYVRKGHKVMVAGTPELKTYTGQDGVAVYKIAVNATEVVFLTPKAGHQGDENSGYTPPPTSPKPKQEIPF